jgi:uncharacterized protein YecT (DUF1311 family)
MTGPVNGSQYLRRIKIERIRFACLLTAATVPILWPVAGHCQAPAELKWLVDTMTRLCLSGGNETSLKATGTGGEDLMLRSANAEGKLQGEFYIDRSRAEGMVGGINNTISKLQAEQASEVRRCLEPLRIRLLEISISQSGTVSAPQPGSVNTSQPATVSAPQPGSVNTSQPAPVSAPQPGSVNTSQPAPVSAPQPGSVNTSQPATVSAPQPGSVDRSQPGSVASQTKNPSETSSTPRPTPSPSSAEDRSFHFDPGGINESPQGFACRKAAMPTDYVICSFQEVYDINTQHAVAWWATMSRLTRSQKDALIQDQRNWLEMMLRKCGLPMKGKPSVAEMNVSAPCVRSSYVHRIKYIRNYGA